ncbi:MAG: LytTR family DNA-binding domain-containing protein [Myxococcota bacterium]
MTLRVVFADDEKMARKRMRRLLGDLPVTIVGEASSGREVLPFLSQNVDVAILDIDMPDLDGMEVARVAKAQGVAVIFATAHEQHAVRAFSEGAVHYLLKPVDAPALAAALERVEPARPERIAVTVAGEVHLLKTAEVSHALFDGQLVTIVAAGKEWLSERSLQDLERVLTGDEFLRVHRRAILNLDFVEKLRPLPSGGYTAVMLGGGEVPVSRQAGRDLRKRLGL